MVSIGPSLPRSTTDTPHQPHPFILPTCLPSTHSLNEHSPGQHAQGQRSVLLRTGSPSDTPVWERCRGMDLFWGPSPHPAHQGAFTAAPHTDLGPTTTFCSYIWKSPRHTFTPVKVSIKEFGQSRARLSDCHLPMTAEPPRHHECAGRRVRHHARYRGWRRPDAAAEAAGSCGHP